MRIFIPGFILFLLYAVFARWFFVCEVRGLCDAPPEPARAQSLELVDGDAVILQGFDEFLFKTDSIRPTLNENNQAFLQGVVGYLQSHPDKKLTIIGRYLEEEASSGSGYYENLGIGRAAEVEFLLEDLGVEELRIFLDHEMVSDSLPRPLAFRVPADSSAYKQLQFNFKDMTYSQVNFAYDSYVFEPKEGFRIYADSVKSFLDRQPDYRLLIIGHTDEKGTEEYNEGLGAKRAQSAMQYLRDLGVTSEIKLISKGESEPVAANTYPDGTDNPEGRRKNRRVNFKLVSTLENVDNPIDQ